MSVQSVLVQQCVLGTMNVPVKKVLPCNFDFLKSWFITNLSAKHENRAQVALSKVCALLKASDTSSSSNCMFSDARKVYTTNNIYPASAKLDLISNVSPMGLELKATPPTKHDSTSLVDADVAGLAQGLQRCYVIRNTDATLSCFVLIVITGRSAWHIRFDRDLRKYGSKETFETVYVHRIAHEDVWKIWMAYNELTVKKPNWFLTSEALHLRSVLSCFTVPSLCATRLIAKSKHNVYGVSLPQAVPFRTVGNVSKTVLGVTLLSHDFCVKVIPSDYQFGIEPGISTAVGNSYNSLFPDRRHYLLRTHSVSASSASDAVSGVTDDLGELDVGSDVAVDTTDNPLLYPPVEDEGGELEGAAASDTAVHLVRLAQHRKSQMLSQRPVTTLARRSFDYTDQCKWRCSEESDFSAISGGCLVMSVGLRVPPIRFPAKMSWIRGVHESLLATHKAGFYHCDIRTSNVLLFGDHYQLIDYDSAVDQKDPTFKFVEGGQYDLRPASLSGAKIESQVTWSALLDAEMTSVCLLRFQEDTYEKA